MIVRMRAAVAISATVLIGVAFSQTQSAAPAKRFSIIGRVIGQTGAPITTLPFTTATSYPTLTLKATDGSMAPATTEADPYGKFTFPGLLPAQYELEVRATAYITLHVAVDARDGRNVDLDATYGRHIDIGYLSMAIEPGNAIPVSISGRVKAPVTKENVKGAVVTLREPGQMMTTAWTYTGRDGTFTFRAVPPARYNLAIEVPGFKILHKLIEAGDGRKIETGDLYVELL